ncbi:Uncharacterised protein [uncultured Clostridium sp.]|nr:Uncharacterised protein [uncultured Clostridium sp.]SCJ45082.1 Uncharacterised protein [uncultured Clostridium sp.]
MNTDKKRNLRIYLVFLISFLTFSIYGFINFNKKTKEKINKPSTENAIEITSEKATNNETKSIDEVGSEYKNTSIDLVKEFLKSYHLIQSTNPIDDFKKSKDILAEPLYLELENEVVGNSSVKSKGLVYRTIEDMKVYDYSFDDYSKEIHVRADIHSNWLNSDKKISSKNELTKYDFLITNFNGDWKISQITTKIY